MGEWDGRSSSNRFRGNHRYGQKNRRRSRHVPLRTRFYQATHGDFNPNVGSIAIIGLVVLGVLGGVALYQTPAFHSMKVVCAKTSMFVPGAPCEDPTTLIWSDNGAQGNLNNYKTNAAVIQTGSTCPSFATSPCIQLNANSANVSIALTQTTIGDLGIANGKTLLMAMVWSDNGNPAMNDNWGYFLTTNSSLTLHKLGATTQYIPAQDPNVVYETKMICLSANCVLGSSANIDTFTYIKTTSSQTDSIDSEAKSNCFLQQVDSCYMHSARTFSPFTGSVATEAFQYMNLTGTTQGGTCSINSGGNNRILGPGCSFLLNGDLGPTPSGTSTQTQPITIPQGKYYLGFFSSSHSTIFWTFDNSAGTGEMNIGSFNAGPVGTVSPTIDTGGFFGPVIGALISIGVFIAQNVINFFVFLYNLIVPLISTVLSLLSGFVAAIFNAIGGVFGDSALGTQMLGFVADFVSFLNNAFANLVGLVALIVTMINNITTFITNFFNTSNFTNLLFGGSGFLGALVNLWTIVNGIWADFAKWFLAGTLTAAAILQIDWVIGMLWTAVEPDLTGFQAWLDFNELVIKQLFQIAYWLFELGLDVLFKIVMIIKGRVGWFDVAGNG